jgi:hypothetical protein
MAGGGVGTGQDKNFFFHVQGIDVAEPPAITVPARISAALNAGGGADLFVQWVEVSDDEETMLTPMLAFGTHDFLKGATR